MRQAQLINKIRTLKNKKLKIGLCHGVFDLLHYGHLKHFEEAKSICDYLIVSITADRFVKKGFNRPIHNENERKKIIENIEYIDHVIISNFESGVESIDLIKPDLYFKGSDYKMIKNDKTKNIILEIQALKKNKGKIFFTDKKHMSSSKIINSLGLSLTIDQKEFIQKIKKKFDINLVLSSIRNLKKNKVIVLGDLIVDRYIYGHVVGKSSKEPHLVSNYSYKEDYVGGAAAVANHVSDFVNKVTLITDHNGEKSISKLLKEKLNKNIVGEYLSSGSENNCSVKTRFIDILTRYKLFGSYELSNLNSEVFRKKLSYRIKKQVKKNDLIIVADFSNNFFTDQDFSEIKKARNFKCGMVQKNSNNSSSYNLKNLSNFNLICINEGELRSEIKDTTSEITKLAKSLIAKMKLDFLLITRGSSGIVLVDNKNKVFYCPAFNLQPVDKIGAGDSILAVISILLSNKIDPNIALLISSIVSSFVVDNLGNKYVARKFDIERSLEYIFK